MKKMMAIIQTPFHLLQLERFITSNKEYIVELIVFSSSIDPVKIKSFFKQVQLVELVPYKFQVKKMRTLSVIKKYKKDVQIIKKYIGGLNITYFDSVVMFTDKDVFNQMLMKSLKKSQEVIAIDEGIGFYRNERYRDLVLKFFYPLLTYVLFGVRYHYVARLGTLSRIDRVLVRMPELLTNNKKTERRYERFNQDVVDIEYNALTRNVLVLTSPMVEDFHMNDILYKNDLSKLFDFLKQNDLNVFVKRHPREKGGLMFEYPQLDQSIPVEEVDLSRFSYIINFCSSSVIDIMANKFPPNRLISINIASFESGYKFFHSARYFRTLRDFFDNYDDF